MSNKNTNLFNTMFGSTKTINVKLDGKTPLKVTYDQKFFTLDEIEAREDEQAQILAAHEEGTPEYNRATFDLMKKRLAEIIVSWEVNDPATGEMVPITEETFGGMTVKLVSELLHQLSEDAAPKSPNQ